MIVSQWAVTGTRSACDRTHGLTGDYYSRPANHRLHASAITRKISAYRFLSTVLEGIGGRLISCFSKVSCKSTTEVTGSVVESLDAGDQVSHRCNSWFRRMTQVHLSTPMGQNQAYRVNSVQHTSSCLNLQCTVHQIQ